MADTVNNHGVIIATEGTGHVARAAPASDVCWLPTHQAAIPANNYIATTELSSGKTTKTLINNHAIWTKVGKLDKSPSMAPHAGTGGGVVDAGAYLKHAWPAAYSKDVLVEGNGVVRTNDATHQNRSNTFGMVDGSAAHPEENALSDAFKKRCVVVEVEGEEINPPGTEEPKGGARTFGPPPPAKGKAAAGAPASKEATYLGVFSGSKIKLKATREDATSAVKGPAKCVLGTHTYWTAVTTGNMFWILNAKDTIQDHEGDKWTLALPGGKSNMPKLAAVEESKTKFLGPGAKDAIKEERAAGKALKKEAKAAGVALPKEGDGKTWFSMGVEFSQDLAKAYQLWKLQESPPTCTITARACGGARQLKLQIYPEDEFEFDLFSDTWQSALSSIKGIAKCVEWIGKTFKFPFKFEFLQKPHVKLKIAYKELALNKRGFIRQQVRRSWSLVFSFEPFLRAMVSIHVPVTTFMAAIANTMAPGAGTAVMSTIQWALDKVGCRADVVFEVWLELAPEVALTVDEYDEFVWAKKTEVKLVLTFVAGIELAWPSFSLKVNSYMENTITLGDWEGSEDPDKLLEFKLKGFIQLGIKGSITVDVMSWFHVPPVNKDFNWKPTFLKFPEGDGKVLAKMYLPMPKSGRTAKPGPVKTE